MVRQSRRHFHSISTCTNRQRQSLHVATSRTLWTTLHNRVAIAEGHLWPTHKPEVMARLPGRRPKTIGTHKTGLRTQCLPQCTTNSFCHGLRGWPFVSRRTIGGQQDLRSNPTEGLVTTNRWARLGKTISFLGRNSTNNGDHIVHPTITPQGISTFDLNVYADADWAGCPTTRKSTSGFTMTLLGATIHFGSRTQAVVALSSAESELYAIGTAAQEVLHAMNFIKEAMAGNKSSCQNTYRFNKRQEHSNKNRQQQESKAHWPQIPVHTTTCAHWDPDNPQGWDPWQPSSQSMSRQTYFTSTCTMLACTASTEHRQPTTTAQEFHYAYRAHNTYTRRALEPWYTIFLLGILCLKQYLHYPSEQVDLQPFSAWVLQFGLSNLMRTDLRGTIPLNLRNNFSVFEEVFLWQITCMEVDILSTIRNSDKMNAATFLWQSAE